MLLKVRPHASNTKAKRRGPVFSRPVVKVLRSCYTFRRRSFMGCQVCVDLDRQLAKLVSDHRKADDQLATGSDEERAERLNVVATIRREIAELRERAQKHKEHHHAF